MLRRVGVSRLLKRVAFVAFPLLLLCMPLRAQTDTDNVTYMGRAAISADDYLTAIRYFNQVIEAKPFLNMPYYYRAYAKFCLDDFSGAEEDCSRSIDRNPYIVEVYRLRGICRIRNAKYNEAIADYSRVIKEEPDDEAALYNRALCRVEMKQYDEADAEMADFLKRWPHITRAYNVRTQIALEKKDTAKAMAWLDSLIAKKPEQPEAWAFKGRYALSKDSFSLADSCLTRAIKYDNDNYIYYVSRALARHGLNRFGLAIADYDKTIALVPEHFVAHYNRGLLRALVGDNKRAIEDFNFVIKQEPDNTLAIYNRALLKQKTGDYRGAIADYSRLIKTYPYFLYGYQMRAECRRKVGDIRGALNDETVVARAELDLMFGKPTRRTNKKVRKRSEHSLDQYQQLVTDEAEDSTGSQFGKLFAADLFGKVQNKKADKRLLPPYELTLRPPVAEKDYTSVAFLPELTQLAQRVEGARLLFATGFERGAETLRGKVFAEEKSSYNRADSLLLEAVLAADAYDYVSALAHLDSAQAASNDKPHRLLVEVQRSAVRHRQWQAEQTAAQKAETTAELLTLAATALASARKMSPDSPSLLFNEGCLLAARGDLKQAEESFSRAIALDARFAEAYYNRGLVRLLSGNNEEAIADFSRAGELGLYRAYSLLKLARQ